MAFDLSSYHVSWSQYVSRIIEEEPGVDHNATVHEVLWYFAEQLIQRAKIGDRTVCTIDMMPLKRPPELCAFVDAFERQIVFGTEAEIYTRFDNAAEQDVA